MSWEDCGGDPGDKMLIKDSIADAFLQQILTRADEYDVIATMNLNGDYISDALAAQVGGIGIAPGGNINYDTGHAVFEATHGTAPKYAGQDKVNPGSVILSGVMMLRYLGWTEAADLIEAGHRGRHRRPDRHLRLRPADGRRHRGEDVRVRHGSDRKDERPERVRGTHATSREDDMTKVTVVGAGKYGSTTAQRLAEADLADEVVMTDIVEGLPQGLALDMNQSRPLERYRTIGDRHQRLRRHGGERCGGHHRRPAPQAGHEPHGPARGERQDRRRRVTREIMAYSPDPVIIVVTNPLDHMTTLAAEVSGLPHQPGDGPGGQPRHAPVSSTSSPRPPASTSSMSRR